MKRVAALVVLLASADARAEDASAPPLDVGLRFGYARPVGAIDAGTRATDLSHGGAPFVLDGSFRINDAKWSLSLGGALGYAFTIPKLCGSYDDCKASLGHDVELLALARLRGPRWRSLLPEAELGTGFSWSSRSLVDNGTSSTRSFAGPVLVHAALVPSLVLGPRWRLGLVLGGSLRAVTASTLEAPGISEEIRQGNRIHGTLDLAVRLGASF